MVLCRVCHRRQGDPCPGCRTLDRIRWLWGAKLRPGEEVEGLAVLRNCAGALSDLVEEGFSTEPPPPFGLPPLPAVPVGGDSGVPVTLGRGSGPAHGVTPAPNPGGADKGKGNRPTPEAEPGVGRVKEEKESKDSKQVKAPEQAAVEVKEELRRRKEKAEPGEVAPGVSEVSLGSRSYSEESVEEEEPVPPSPKREPSKPRPGVTVTHPGLTPVAKTKAEDQRIQEEKRRRLEDTGGRRSFSPERPALREDREERDRRRRRRRARERSPSGRRWQDERSPRARGSGSHSAWDRRPGGEGERPVSPFRSPRRHHTCEKKEKHKKNKGKAKRIRGQQWRAAQGWTKEKKWRQR